MVKVKVQELEMLKSQIMSDVSICLSRSKIDEAMLMFIHIYNELGSALDMSVDTSSIKDITQMHNDCITLLKDTKFRQKLETFYITKNGEAGAFLFDDTVKDTEIYVLDKPLYGQVNELFVRLFRVTGLIKEELMKFAGSVDLDGFDD